MSSQPYSSLWSVLLAQPQRLSLVQEQLENASVEHWVPLEEVFKGGRRYVNPLFGSYVLFAVDVAWRRVLNLRGVAGVLLRDTTQTPAIVEPGELARVRALCGDSGVRHAERPAVRVLAYGDLVMPKTGPLARHVGRYDGTTKRGEAAVFRLFGREQRVTFRRGDLIAA